MNTGKTTFAQFMDFLPWSTFDRIVARYEGNRGVRKPPCAQLPRHERGRLGLKDVWARKYNVEGKRAEIRAAEQAAHDKKIRDEAVRETEMKYVQQRANPLLRTPAPSTQPFIPTRMGEGNKPVQPWEEPKGVMKERRIGSALKSQFESEAVN